MAHPGKTIAYDWNRQQKLVIVKEHGGDKQQYDQASPNEMQDPAR